MRQTRLKLAATIVNGKHFWQVTAPKLGGGRVRKTFKDRSQAKGYYELARAQLQDFGVAAMSISDALRTEAVKCAETLRPFGKTISDATKFYADHLRAISMSRTVNLAVDGLRAACAADGRSVRYLRDLKYRLGRFQSDFGERQIAEITTSDIDNWLRGLQLGAVSRNTFRRRLVTLFKFAKINGWCQTVPPAEAARVREISDEIEILTPHELAVLLSVASSETVPYWSIGAFAGLRAAEIERLDWADVNLTQRWIKVLAANSKSASRRFVHIEPNLGRWLHPYRQSTGQVVPENLRVKLLADRQRAAELGVLVSRWPKNGLRHSFASYHLARFKDAARLALEMGHVGQDLIFRHYRQLVTARDAGLYWKITPSTSQSAATRLRAD